MLPIVSGSVHNKRLGFGDNFSHVRLVRGGFCLAAAFPTDAAAAGVSVRLGLTSIPALHNKALHQNCFFRYFMCRIVFYSGLGQLPLASLALTEAGCSRRSVIAGRRAFQAGGTSILVECHRAPLEGGFVISCVRRCRRATRPGPRPGRLLQTSCLRDRVASSCSRGAGAVRTPWRPPGRSWRRP